MSDYDTLVWVDIESPGLDPVNDPMLELAIIITDLDAAEEIDRAEWVISPVQPWKHRMDDYVTAMHESSGLLAAVAFHGRPHGEVEDEAREFVAAHTHAGLLAGSGVARFDRLFLAQQMPGVNALLHYAELDVGIIRRAFALANPDLEPYPTAEPKRHRAMADIEDHLAEWRFYRDIVRSL